MMYSFHFSEPYNHSLVPFLYHAVRYYNLESNPVKKVLPISGGRPQEFRYCRREEFEDFITRVPRDTFFIMLQKYAEESGVNRIRVHDLRHSHVSLLILMGFSAVAIGKRVGQKSERITYYYAHLFPGVQEKISE